MKSSITPLVTHVDGFLASQLECIWRFERTAKALKDAWSKSSVKDPMEYSLYWGAWAAGERAAKYWVELRDCGRLLMAHPRSGMWLAVMAEGGAA